jgi:hypothetical protein
MATNTCNVRRGAGVPLVDGAAAVAVFRGERKTDYQARWHKAGEALDVWLLPDRRKPDNDGDLGCVPHAEPRLAVRTALQTATLYLMPSQAGNATFDPLACQDDSTTLPGTGDPQQQLAGFIIGVHSGSPFFDAETIHLAYHEQQVINIRMQVTHFYATLDLKIDYIIGSESGVVHKLIVTDDGHPFAITGIPLGPS